MLPTPERVSTGPSLPHGRLRRIAVIGTSPENADLIEDTAHSLNYWVDTATSGTEVSTLLDEASSLSLAIVDVKSVTKRVQHLCNHQHLQAGLHKLSGLAFDDVSR